MTDNLVSTEWLAAHLNDPALILLDASLHLPGTGRTARTEYEAGHIPGAAFLDLERLRNSGNPLPFMMPTTEQFRHHAGALGVTPNSHIVLYDDAPHVTAARAWFIFRHFGFSRVSILDGGMAAWRSENRTIDNAIPQHPAHSLELVYEVDDVRTKDDILALLNNHHASAEDKPQIVDARSVARFTGEEPETRPDLSSGHIPGAHNLPYTQLFSADHVWKQGDALRQAFLDAGVNLHRPIITSCGSGITASVLLFGAHMLGCKDIALYDGSWTEWGADPKTPKETGLPQTGGNL